MTATAHTHPTPSELGANLASIYRLADHLDATLAMGEDLLRCAADIAPLPAAADHAAIVERQHAITIFARSVRALELGIVSRLLQARTRAIEVRDVHPRFQPLLALFVGGLAPLADAAQGRDGGLGDISAAALSSGADALQFLRSRAVVPAGTQSLAGFQKAQITDTYLLAERIPLGTLLDMVATALDALDLAFDLYAEPRTDA